MQQTSNTLDEAQVQREYMQRLRAFKEKERQRWHDKQSNIAKSERSMINQRKKWSESQKKCQEQKNTKE